MHHCSYPLHVIGALQIIIDIIIISDKLRT